MLAKEENLLYYTIKLMIVLLVADFVAYLWRNYGRFMAFHDGLCRLVAYHKLLKIQ